jgi:hypothetical protein
MSLLDTPLLLKFSTCEWTPTNLDTSCLILDHLVSRDLASLFLATLASLKWVVIRSQKDPFFWLVPMRGS